MASPKWAKKTRATAKPASAAIADLPASMFAHLCTACGAPSTYYSALDMSWCPEHDYRGKIADWAKAHSFPRLYCFPFAISADEVHWRFSIGFGSDDFMWTAYAAIECLKDEGAA